MKSLFIDHASGIGSIDKLPALNRGLLYGDGFFTTMRICDGRPLLWKYHQKRLEETANFLRLELPEVLKDPNSWLNGAVSHGMDARCRVTVFRAGSGRYTPATNMANAVVTLEPADGHGYCWSEPVEYSVAKECVVPHAATQYKLLGKVSQIRAATEQGREKEKEKDVLVLTSNGCVSELLSSNLYAILDGKVVTPPLADGCLNGTIRQMLLEKHWCEERSLSLKDLEESEELFGSNSMKGLFPVSNDFSSSFRLSEALFKKFREIALLR